MEQKARFKLDTLTLVKIAVLSSLGTILMFFPKIQGVLAPWLDLDLGNVPGLIGAFALGPVAGIVIEFIRNLLHFLLGTSTGGVGELSNFMVSLGLILPAALIYKHNKTLKNAIWGLSIGVIAANIIACFTNLYIILPIFFKDMSIDEGLQMFSKGEIKNSFDYVAYSLIPFNLIKGAANALVVGLLYKRLRKFI